MLKKRLGVEAIERDWRERTSSYFKIPTILIIPEGCKLIGDCAFYGCESLREVVIPESVGSIGGYAFRGCSNATMILKKPKSKINTYPNTFNYCRYVKEETRS